MRDSANMRAWLEPCMSPSAASPTLPEQQARLQIDAMLEAAGWGGLFLVDRGNLGRQALTEFQKSNTPDDGGKFTERHNKPASVPDLPSRLTLQLLVERGLRNTQQLADSGRLRELPAEKRTTPISLSGLRVLHEEQTSFLLDEGLPFPDEDEAQCCMPELVRYGLGFGLARRGRSRVLSLQ